MFVVLLELRGSPIHNHIIFVAHNRAFFVLWQVEDTTGEFNSDGVEVAVTVLSAAQPNVWIREIGSDVAVGEVVLAAGTRAVLGIFNLTVSHYCAFFAC